MKDALFFLLGNFTIVLYLVYVYIRNKKQSTQLKKQVDLSWSELRREQDQRQEDIQKTQDTFDHQLKLHMKESERYKFTMGILLINIDDVNLVNNALGQEVADLLFHEMTVRLEPCVREVDSISRINKDTFAVMLTKLAKPETAAVVVQRMLQALSQPFRVNQHEVYVTACIGVAIYPTDAQDSLALFDCAKHALRLAQEKGHYSYQFYQEKMHKQSQRDLTLYTNLSRDSVYKEFVVRYQPMINTVNQSVKCMDVMLNWEHPEIGEVSSQELFQYAERQRKWNAISEWLLRHACQQFLAWRSLGFQPELLGISLSIRQLESSQFIYNISQILQELKFDPKWLLIEIKESFSPVSFDILQKSFNMLSYQGIQIAIDHFGVGSLSLAFLRRFKIQYVKLAPSFTDDILQDPEAVTLLSSIVQLASNMGIQVVAQGVELKEQMDKLQALGCSLMQGTSLGEPMLESDVVNKMTNASIETTID